MCAKTMTLASALMHIHIRGKWVTRLIGQWLHHVHYVSKWASRLMEQLHCYISPFTVKKGVKAYFINLEEAGLAWLWYRCNCQLVQNYVIFKFNIRVIHLK